MYTVHSLIPPSTSPVPALAFAAQELQRCLLRLNAGSPVQVTERSSYRPEETGLWLALFADAGLTPRSAHPLDDEIHIAVEPGNGLIAGANPRSLLIAVYRYLEELGCRWLRPGLEGEFFPPPGGQTHRVQLHERPSYRHRAMCIEGAVSLENVLDMVDWLPKVGLSGYFMQFREGFTFFERWYSHKNNPFKSPEPFGVEQARAFTRQIEAELQKRGLAYHAIGHGWTCEAYGIPCLGWDPEPGRTWPPAFLRDVAEVNGQRAVPWNIVSIAALCYSNPQVQTRLVDCVVEYAASHPQIDLLHVWLDDGFNNKCECETCRNQRPADDYIAILNAIDDRLTRRGLPHKVVFLAYQDMLWPPETARLRNPGRFVFMFAPIGRTYRETFAPVDPVPPLPPFDRNRLQIPGDIPALLACLRGWQTTFHGDSFIYDYHWIGAGLHQQDPGHLRLARRVTEDVKALKSLGLDGMVSCQLQRVFFPTGLGQYAMARTLWNDGLSFDDLAADYFTSALGPQGGEARAYLERLADLLDYGWLEKMDGTADREATARCRSALAVIRRFLPVIRRGMRSGAPCHARSWRHLFHHAQVTRRLARMIQAWGQPARAARRWQAVKRAVCRNEDDLRAVLDVWAFVSAYERLLRRREKSS